MTERTWAGLLAELVAGVDQDAATSSWAMEQILGGNLAPSQLAGFLVALRSKGETVTEVTGLADAMLGLATPIEIGDRAVDVVGSGGDRANTVNISTMAAIVAAGAGARVVKHGNRAASSACGAADVLEALGVVLDVAPERQQQIVQEVGIGFLFAPLYHPAMRHAAVTRRELGIPTVFNVLGPLANPAQPLAAAVGVADARLAGVIAGVFSGRGQQGLVVHGGDGLDELTTTTSSSVWVFAEGVVSSAELDPAELGLPRAAAEDLVGGAAAVNAQVVRELLDGRTGPVRDIVLLNAAAALVAYDQPDPVRLRDQFADGLVRAADSIDSGAAQRKLADWVAATAVQRTGSSGGPAVR